MEREIEINENENELVVILPFTGKWESIVLSGFWCLVWIGIFTMTIKEGLLMRPGFAYHVSWFLTIWLVVFRYFLWHVIGKEKVVMDRKHLTITKLGTFFTFSRKFELELIDDFSWSERGYTPRYRLSGGHIVFDYWDRPEYFGRSVDKRESLKVVTRLNDWKRKNFRNSNQDEVNFSGSS